MIRLVCALLLLAATSFSQRVAVLHLADAMAKTEEGKRRPFYEFEEPSEAPALRDKVMNALRAYCAKTRVDLVLDVKPIFGRSGLDLTDAIAQSVDHPNAPVPMPVSGGITAFFSGNAVTETKVGKALWVDPLERRDREVRELEQQIERQRSSLRRSSELLRTEDKADIQREIETKQQELSQLEKLRDEESTANRHQAEIQLGPRLNAIAMNYAQLSGATLLVEPRYNWRYIGKRADISSAAANILDGRGTAPSTPVYAHQKIGAIDFVALLATLAKFESGKGDEETRGNRAEARLIRAVEEVQKEGGYDWIFSLEEDDESILYFAPGLNVADQVKKKWDLLALTEPK